MRFVCFVAIAVVLVSPARATQSCGGEPGWATKDFRGIVADGDTYTQSVGGKAFVLGPTRHGWKIFLLDANGREIATFSPPARPVETNALNVSGWHFRNLSNTGPNTGDVNAPQRIRRFAFGVLATRAHRRPDLAPPKASALPDGFGGIGRLVIEDFKLADLGKRQKARMVSLTFQVCLTWFGDGEKPDPIVVADPGVAFDTVVSDMKTCGLDFRAYRLSDRMAGGREGGQSPWLNADMDGDGNADLVVSVRRLRDRRAGIAICLKTEGVLKLAGFDGRIGKHLDPDYFGRTDWWNVFPRGPVSKSEAEGPPPTLPGDAIVMGKDGASSVILYLDADRKLSSYWQGD